MTRKKIIVLDTETAPAYASPKVNPNAMRTYDIGYIVREKATGRVLERRSFVVAEVFFNVELMRNAYYANKLPMYREGIQRGEWVVDTFARIREQLFADIAAYNVREVWAYNAIFDRCALNATTNALSRGMVKDYLAGSGAEWRDIWRFADNITGKCAYGEWAVANGYQTDTGTPQTGAEHVTRYLYDDGFIEAHTALEDVMIESRILTECLTYHVKQPTTCGCGYLAAQRWAKRHGYYIREVRR